MINITGIYEFIIYSNKARKSDMGRCILSYVDKFILTGEHSPQSLIANHTLDDLFVEIVAKSEEKKKQKPKKNVIEEIVRPLDLSVPRSVETIPQQTVSIDLQQFVREFEALKRYTMVQEEHRFRLMYQCAHNALLNNLLRDRLENMQSQSNVLRNDDKYLSLFIHSKLTSQGSYIFKYTCSSQSEVQRQQKASHLIVSLQYPNPNLLFNLMRHRFKNIFFGINVIRKDIHFLSASEIRDRVLSYSRNCPFAGVEDALKQCYIPPTHQASVLRDILLDTYQYYFKYYPPIPTNIRFTDEDINQYIEQNNMLALTM